MRSIRTSGWTPGGSSTYEIAVTNGTYRVDLLLAEIYSGIVRAWTARLRHVARGS